MILINKYILFKLCLYVFKYACLKKRPNVPF